MELVDDVIPAACHLTGREAPRVLRAALEPLGGRLLSARASHVHYRPGYDVAVRFDAEVAWAGGAPTTETLLAGTTVRGVPRGTLPVEGHLDDGRVIELGVWRWPFDPRLPGLEHAVVPRTCARMLNGLVAEPVRLDVVVYRPTQRAVVRLDDADGRTLYLKVLRPRDVEPLVTRHRVLGEAGLPVPPVVHADTTLGLVVLGAIDGPTARDRYLTDGPWPSVDDHLDVIAAIGRADLGHQPARPGRLTDALGHATMIERVLPDQAERLARITDAVRDALTRPRLVPCVHGDLYESQLITAPDSGRIVGVIDLDDAGPGDPLDDRATVLAHLWTRGATTPRRLSLLRHVHELRAAFAPADAAELDVVTAAVLVGLAAGPFRVQAPGWRRDARRMLARAELLVTAGGRIPAPR